MMERLGERATLKVLNRRELENYLLDERAMVGWLKERLQKAGKEEAGVDQDRVRQALLDGAEALKSEVVRLRVERRVLSPIFLQVRQLPGSAEERLEAGLRQLSERREQLAAERQRITKEVERDWTARRLELVPGSLLLEAVAKRFGLAYLKERGDGVLLARHLEEASIEREIQDLLREIGGG